MKRLLSIIMLISATLFYLVLTTLPHHHHGAVDCFMMERCDTDGDINDCHTHHHGGGENDSCDILHLKQTVMTAKKCITQNLSQHSSTNIITAYIGFSATLLPGRQHAHLFPTTTQHASNQWNGCVRCLRGPPVV